MFFILSVVRRFSNQSQLFRDELSSLPNIEGDRFGNQKLEQGYYEIILKSKRLTREYAVMYEQYVAREKRLSESSMNSPVVQLLITLLKQGGWGPIRRALIEVASQANERARRSGFEPDAVRWFKLKETIEGTNKELPYY